MANDEDRYTKYLDVVDALIQTKLTGKAKLLTRELVDDFEDYQFYLLYRRSVQALVNSIKASYDVSNDGLPELVGILKATAKLLDGQMTIDDYLDMANEVQGHPISGAKTLSALMFAVGLCGLTISLCLISFSYTPASPLLFVGLALSLVVYFASLPVNNLGNPSSFSEQMLDVGSLASVCGYADKRHFEFFQAYKDDALIAAEDTDDLFSVASFDAVG